MREFHCCHRISLEVPKPRATELFSDSEDSGCGVERERINSEILFLVAYHKQAFHCRGKVSFMGVKLSSFGLFHPKTRQK